MSEKLTCIIAGKLYDGIHNEFLDNCNILIKGKYICKVGPQVQIPENAEIIDLSDATVTPGMIDSHMHLNYFDWRTIREDEFTTSEESKTLAALKTAQKTLARGFTTVRHVGGFGNGFGVLDVKRAIENGHFSGSRIIAAPRFMCSPGSHGDFSQCFSKNPDMGYMAQNRCLSLGSGKDFFINAVREEIKYGADFIKIMATGGFFTPNDNPVQQQLNDEEMQAIITTAHEWGKTVTAHVYSPMHIKKLIQFGIDGIEHGSLMDDETAQMMLDNDVYIVPTFCPYEEAVHYDADMIKTKQPEFRKKLEYYKDALCAGREVIKKYDLKMGYGTDFVATHMNYECGYEFKAWMDSGMGTFRTLKAATKTNAEICQLEDKIGTIEVGKYADIAAWKRDLFTDPCALLDCAFVMKEGMRYPTETSETF